MEAILPETNAEVDVVPQSFMAIVYVADTFGERRQEESRLNNLCEGLGECHKESLAKRGIEKHRPR